jgi:hypothetical protein
VIVMPVSFTSEVNPVTLVAVGTALVTVIRFWLYSSHVAGEARKEAEACFKCAQDAHHKIELLQAAIHAREVMQAERLVSREVLREVENRLAESIERLGDRLDNLFREVVTLRRDRA